jgi:pyruvate formate lyase activating enzyme
MAELSRRAFLDLLGRCGLAAAGAGLLLSAGPRSTDALFGGWLPGPGDAQAGDRLAELLRSAPRARYWIPAGSAAVREAAACNQCHEDTEAFRGDFHEHDQPWLRCQLCAQNCLIADGERGRCRARHNAGGELKSLVYGRPLSIHVDPIEKKPFYHFLPGAQAFSLATSGCPLRCKFCQNWELSQASPEDYETEFLTPESIVRAAGQKAAPVIAFTYNEPTVFTEYLTDIARAARPAGIRSALVSCGFMNEAPLTEICGLLDAIKIDLKGFDESFYREVCQAELKPVLRSIRQVAASKVHLELVNLVVPTLNDSEPMLKALADWVMGELGPDVPVHFTRFHPDYQLRHLPPTPVATLERARQIAMERGLHFVYVGNVPGHPGNHTYCPSCGRIAIERSSFFVSELHMKEGRCDTCGGKIAGVWS